MLVRSCSRNSVHPSVHPSHACIVRKLNDALQIFWYHTEGQSLCYYDTKSGWSATPPSLWNLRSKWPIPFKKRRLQPISTCNISTVRDSDKSLVMTNRKLTMGFPMSYRWSAYVTPKSRKGWLKNNFFVFLKEKSTWLNKVCTTKFLCVKTSSGKVVEQSISYETIEKYRTENVSFHLKCWLELTYPVVASTRMLACHDNTAGPGAVSHPNSNFLHSNTKIDSCL